VERAGWQSAGQQATLRAVLSKPSGTIDHLSP
jgi:hypothetical protein